MKEETIIHNYFLERRKRLNKTLEKALNIIFTLFLLVLSFITFTVTTYALILSKESIILSICHALMSFTSAIWIMITSYWYVESAKKLESGEQ